MTMQHRAKYDLHKTLQMFYLLYIYVDTVYAHIDAYIQNIYIFCTLHLHVCA